MHISVKLRSQYLGPCPGVPVANDDHIKDVHLDPSAGPADAYCLLTLDPKKFFSMLAGFNSELIPKGSEKDDQPKNKRYMSDKSQKQTTKCKSRWLASLPCTPS